MDLFGRVALLAAVLTLAAIVRPAAAGEAAAVTPSEAIARVVAERLGGDVAVEITSLDTEVQAERELQAMPEPGGRADERMRFVMMVGRARRGIALATVKVLGTYARAARAIGRDETIGGDAIELVHGELPPVALKRLPPPGGVAGHVARRDIAAGEPRTQAVVEVPPAVRPGDIVVLTVAVGTVEVVAQATASASGYEGEVIRVVPEGGRPLRARITGPGSVEVVR